MPRAPDSGRLFQEDLRRDPFWMLVTCILINRTHWRQVAPVLEKLRARCEGAFALCRMPIEDLITILRPLGFYNRRASVLRRFSQAWMEREPETWQDVMRMPGCGEYAAQSWQIFEQNERPCGPVADHKLRWYLEHRPEVMR